MLPHAIAELAELGLLPRLDEVAIRTRELIYANRLGQEIWREPRGVDAGYQVPQFSIHRGRLQGVLYEAVLDRLGRKAVAPGHAFTSFSQTEGGVKARFGRGHGRAAHDGGRHPGGFRRHPLDDATPALPRRGRAHVERRADVARRHSGQGLPRRAHDDRGRRLQQQAGALSDRAGSKPGRQLINWVVTYRMGDGSDPPPRREDWNRKGTLAELMPHVKRFETPHVDLVEAGEGRAGLLRVPHGRPRSLAALDARPRDAARRRGAPHVPRGLERREPGDPGRALPGRRTGGRRATRAQALAAYEAERLPKTAEIVRNNRKGGPEGVIDEVERRAPDGFESIDDVLSHAEREAIVKGYAQLAGFAKEQVNRGGRADQMDTVRSRRDRSRGSRRAQK